MLRGEDGTECSSEEWAPPRLDKGKDGANW
jgi:hypothetical protein